MSHARFNTKSSRSRSRTATVRVDGEGLPAHRWRTRSLLAVIAVGFGFTLLWTPGVTWQQMRGWFGSENPKHVAPTAAPVAMQVPSGRQEGKIATGDSGIRQRGALILIDTAPGSTTEQGTARIGIDPNNPQTYSTGAVIVNGARLTRIYPDHVVLERDGKSVDLYRQGARGHELARRNEILVVGQEAPQAVIAEQGPSRVGIAAITDVIRPNAVLDGDHVHGFAVYAGERAGVFASLGLRPGDVITAFNGVPASDGDTANAMFEQLARGGEVEVTVETGSQVRRVVLNGRLIAERSPVQAGIGPPN